ncbi:MAG TPA: ABC transporter ATP-binding protein [Cyclobacteriaceae bacterium]|nr:ABC transporter ATP-binding protein [Cyclobacteriaceae bacterium]
MSDIAVKVENLGKKFLIGHQIEGDLRRSFVGKFRNLIASSNGQSREEFWALKDVSFEIKKGEAVGIIGRNGAGKSTLLKILSRITDPTSGRFEINGRVSSLLEVGTGFHSELTGRENIYLNGTILGMRRIEIKKKFDAIVDFSGVEKFIDTPVKHYSSGMKVRLAFSVAAHLEPEILIVDEVLAVGDVEFQKKCLGKMDEVSKKEGKTILFVSHNMGVINNLCKGGIWLKQGQVNYTGEINKTIELYLAAFTAEPIDTISGSKKGAKDVRIVNLKFKGKANQEVEDVIGGQPLTIELRYQSEFEYLTNVVVGIVIMNSQGQFLTVLNNKMSNFSFDKIPGTGTISCHLDQLPLMYGRHTLNINFYVNNIPQVVIEGAKHFYVEDGDYYASGFSNASRRQGIYIAQKWMTS